MEGLVEGGVIEREEELAFPFPGYCVSCCVDIYGVDAA